MEPSDGGAEGRETRGGDLADAGSSRGLDYTAAGSRETPTAWQDAERRAARRLHDAGWTLTTGGADGTDCSFEEGVFDPVRKRIVLPMDGFNADYKHPGSPRNRRRSVREPGVYVVPAEHVERCLEIAVSVHPKWEAVLRSRYADFSIKAHIRNVALVLGLDLATPAKFLVGWAPPLPDDRVDGGSATAFAVAKLHGIPRYNLAVPEQARAFAALLDRVAPRP